MHFRRRDVLKLALAGAARCAAPTAAVRSAQKMRILVLGGTSFLGPHVVSRALAAGHTVTLFNRGKTHPELFPGVERIRGDRQPEGGDLSGLAGAREWDAVVDVWPNDPKLVAATAQLLGPRTGQYLFVSSIAAYATYSQPEMDESAALALAAPGYGGNKARCEAALASLLPGRSHVVRPHAIKGVGDDSLDLCFWLSRMRLDEEILAPGDGADLVQYDDVKDVGEWIVDSVERRRMGIFNVFCEPMPIRSFLEGCRQGVDGRARLVWVGADFLRERGVKTFDNMPFWNPRAPPGDRAAFTRISVAKAYAAGWRPRPLVQTVRDAWATYQAAGDDQRQFPQQQWRFEWGISRDKERELLQTWARRS
jgi:2'-hydroxyisoflavone reductase